MVGTATLFSHSARTKHGTSDLMGALSKETPSASIVWIVQIGSAKRYFLIWIALVESVWKDFAESRFHGSIIRNMLNFAALMQIITWLLLFSFFCFSDSMRRHNRWNHFMTSAVTLCLQFLPYRHFKFLCSEHSSISKWAECHRMDPDLNASCYPAQNRENFRNRCLSMADIAWCFFLSHHCRHFYCWDSWEPLSISKWAECHRMDPALLVTYAQTRIVHASSAPVVR